MHHFVEYLIYFFNMKSKLKDIIKIQFGTYAKPEKEGTIPYLQAKNFTEDGVLLGNFDAFLPNQNITNSSLLRKGQVLFAGKGNRFFASEYKQEWGEVIASSLFYVLEVSSENILPEYLAAVLNLPQNISYFQQAGTGSNILSLRKKELEDFEIEIPPLHLQHKIVEMKRLHLKELELADKIKEQKKLLYQASITKILK